MAVIGINLLAQVPATPAAITRSRMDPEAVKRGAGYFAISCANCHGAAAKGTATGPDLVRSTLVEDDEGTGTLITPLLREGRPDKGMPKPNVTDAQASDIAAWLFAQVYGAGTRSTYTYSNILVGDAARGKAFFTGAGGCTACHSVTGNLAGIGAKYNPPTLQARVVSGGAGGRGMGSGATITVRLASGETVEGVALSVDDFDIAMRDTKGEYHSWTRVAGYPTVEFHNPMAKHGEIARSLTDEQMHDLTAYLVTLK